MDTPTVNVGSAAPAKKSITVDELHQRFGSDTHLIESKLDSGEVVVVGARKPSGIIYRKYRQLLFDENRRHTASDALIADCVVYPDDKQERDAVFEEHPALIDQIAQQIVKIAGGGAEVKKL